MTTALAEQYFAVLNIAYFHTATSVIITCLSSNPCHLTCYYTDKKPVRHRMSRIVRGLGVTWGAYWCFVAWNSVEQQEGGDTLTHTFEITPWSYCQTKWLAFGGTIESNLSRSQSPLFEHHHPGVWTHEVMLQIAHNNDDYARLDSVYQSCPSVCPPQLLAGYFYPSRLHTGCGLRFRNVSIPPHATILEAQLIFTAIIDRGGTCPFTRISAEQADNPPDFSEDDWLSARARWQNSGTAIDWDYIPPWTMDGQYPSPHILPVIQEIVNRYFWASGNAMVLFWNDWDERSGNLPYRTRRAYSYNINPAKAPRLYIKWQS